MLVLYSFYLLFLLLLFIALLLLTNSSLFIILFFFFFFDCLLSLTLLLLVNIFNLSTHVVTLPYGEQSKNNERVNASQERSSGKKECTYKKDMLGQPVVQVLNCFLSITFLSCYHLTSKFTINSEG